jgi:hypothetical protein
LTDKIIFFTAKNEADNSDNDDDAVIKKDIISHKNASAGISILELTEEDTDIPLGSYKCDIRIYAEGIQINSSIFFLDVIDKLP